MSPEKTNGYLIRPMRERDIPQALDLDSEAFPTQWPHPSYASFKHELHNRLAHYMVACIENDFEHYIPQGRQGHLSGFKKLVFFGFSFKRKHTSSTVLPPPTRDYMIGMAGFWLMAGEAHLITIGVRNAYRRQGIGERLLIAFLDKAILLNATIATLEVRVSNMDAQSLYKKYGFQETGIRKRYYADNGENALIMSTDPVTTNTFKAAFKLRKIDYRQRWDTIYSIKEIREDTNE